MKDGKLCGHFPDLSSINTLRLQPGCYINRSFIERKIARTACVNLSRVGDMIAIHMLNQYAQLNPPLNDEGIMKDYQDYILFAP